MFRRFSYFLLASCILIAGLQTVAVQFGHPTWGVRTTATRADPLTWSLINASTGLMLIAWGFILMAILPYRSRFVESIMPGLIGLALIVGASVVAPSPMRYIGELAQGYHLFEEPLERSLLFSIATQLVLGTAGFCVSTMTSIGMTWITGSRRNIELTRGEAAACVGGSTMHLLSCVAILAMIVLYAVGNANRAEEISGVLLAFNVFAVVSISAVTARFHSRH